MLLGCPDSWQDCSGHGNSHGSSHGGYDTAWVLGLWWFPMGLWFIDYIILSIHHTVWQHCTVHTRYTESAYKAVHNTRRNKHLTKRRRVGHTVRMEDFGVAGVGFPHVFPYAWDRHGDWNRSWTWTGFIRGIDWILLGQKYGSMFNSDWHSIAMAVVVTVVRDWPTSDVSPLRNVFVEMKVAMQNCIRVAQCFRTRR